MSRNGSGVYNLPAGQPVVTGTVISASVQNTLMQDVANALTTSLATDGQTAMSANLPMGNNKITGLLSGVAPGDAVNLSQLTTGLAGSVTQTFSVAPATLSTQAPQFGQVQPALGYTPVQNGTGVGQSTANAIKVGYATVGGRLKATVDATDLGNIVFDTQLAAYAFLAGLSTQTFSVGPATAPAHAVQLQQLLAPICAVGSASGSSTNVTATVTFTAPGPGILIAIGVKNNSSSAAGQNVSTLTINGTQFGTDNSSISLVNVGTTPVSGAGSVTASYAAAAQTSFSVYVMLIFIPNV